jgi:putative pyruvate formate lyase activating enzyme
MKELDVCMICPRACGVNRNTGATGYCRTDAAYHISSICLHKGEEPVIGGKAGICNVFFSHCNLQCLYCQNHQISSNRRPATDDMMTLEEITNTIVSILNEGAEAVGFVTPSHFIPHVKSIVAALNQLGYHPVTVYNSNGYDTVESLRGLEGIIDVFLPDMKYMDPHIAHQYSGAGDYPDVAALALKEMFRQKGSTLVVSEEGQVLNGLIIRHLVLPGLADDSKRILKWIADELSPSLHLSLMSQYYPTSCVASHLVLSRTISEVEYKIVADELENLGFYRGWVQEMDSSNSYKPDFDREHPFEFNEKKQDK